MSSKKKFGPHFQSDPLKKSSETEEIVSGSHPVLEALRSESNRLQKIYIARGKRGATIAEIRTLARENGVLVTEKDPAELNRLAPGRSHQGVVGMVRPFEPASVDDMIRLAEAQSEPPLIVILDRIHDPQNLGSLIRTANGAGAHGVIVSLRDSCPITTTVSRVSTGALEHTLVAQVPNLIPSVERLKESGLWVYGAAPEADTTLYEIDLGSPVALVIGSEEKGIRPLLKRSCDALFRIPMYGRVASLNASVSGAIALFETQRQRSVSRNSSSFRT